MKCHRTSVGMTGALSVNSCNSPYMGIPMHFGIVFFCCFVFHISADAAWERASLYTVVHSDFRTPMPSFASVEDGMNIHT